ncbi:MAG TPA: DUF5009 domain-containing protein [bacterium]|nr:DUF5009 domain-containing protein [bacterium]
MSGAPQRRWRSLDALRGLSIAAMILVNNPGRWGAGWQFAPLRHAEWHGCTFTDLVFPTFLFCAGVAIVPALGRRLGDRALSPVALLPGIWLRVARLVALGIFLSAFPLLTFADGHGLFEPLLSARIPGVLQRIGVCYGLAATLFLLVSATVRRGILLSCLLLYWPLLTLVPVPGQGPPDLSGPQATLAGYVDRAVFGSHIWVVDSYDPEGLLSTIPALATTLLGLEAGVLLRRSPEPERRVRRLVAFAAPLLAVGLAWSFALPFNKALWTGSYALWTAGIASLALAACVWLFEVRRFDRLAVPLSVYGTNALLVFVGSGLLGRVFGRLWTVSVDGREVPVKSWFFATVLAPYAPPKVASLVFALLWIVAWYLLLRVLYRRGWFWRV